MRFDPEWFLSGATANAAAAEDGAVEPGQPVPNDNYRVDEGHRLFTYKVPANAHVTVITKAPTGTPITVSQLADIVNGTSKLKLFEPLESGVWIVVHNDTVRSIDEQTSRRTWQACELALRRRLAGWRISFVQVGTGFGGVAAQPTDIGM